MRKVAWAFAEIQQNCYIDSNVNSNNNNANNNNTNNNNANSYHTLRYRMCGLFSRQGNIDPISEINIKNALFLDLPNSQYTVHFLYSAQYLTGLT